MDTPKQYPEYSAIEAHIRRAHVERAPYLGHAIAGAIVSAWNDLKRFAEAVGQSPAHPGRIARGASFLNRFAAHR